jgi:hypothetical protein
LQRSRWPEAQIGRIPRRSGGIIEIHVFAVKAWGYVTRLLTAFELVVKGADDALLEIIAALGIYRMRNICVELEARVAVAALVALVAILIQAAAAVVAVAGAKMILLATATAMVGELSRRHGKEQPVIAFDQLHIANHERIVKGKRAKRLETIPLIFAQLDPDVRQIHDEPLSERQALKKRFSDVLPASTVRFGWK